MTLLLKINRLSRPAERFTAVVVFATPPFLSYNRDTPLNGIFRLYLLWDNIGLIPLLFISIIPAILIEHLKQSADLLIVRE